MTQPTSEIILKMFGIEEFEKLENPLIMSPINFSNIVVSPLKAHITICFQFFPFLYFC